MSDPMKDHCPGSMSWEEEERRRRRAVELERQKERDHKDYLQAMRDNDEREARKLQNLMPPPAPKKRPGEMGWGEWAVRAGLAFLIIYLFVQLARH